MLMQNCSLHGNKGWSFIMRGEGSWQLLQNNPWTSKSEKPITQEEHNLLPTKNIMHNLKVRKKNHVPENCPTALSNDGLSLMITILNMSGCYLTNSFNRSLSYHESVKYMQIPVPTPLCPPPHMSQLSRPSKIKKKKHPYPCQDAPRKPVNKNIIGGNCILCNSVCIHYNFFLLFLWA